MLRVPPRRPYAVRERIDRREGPDRRVVGRLADPHRRVTGPTDRPHQIVRPRLVGFGVGGGVTQQDLADHPGLERFQGAGHAAEDERFRPFHVNLDQGDRVEVAHVPDVVEAVARHQLRPAFLLRPQTPDDARARVGVEFLRCKKLLDGVLPGKPDRHDQAILQVVDPDDLREEFETPGVRLEPHVPAAPGRAQVVEQRLTDVGPDVDEFTRPQGENLVDQSRLPVRPPLQHQAEGVRRLAGDEHRTAADHDVVSGPQGVPRVVRGPVPERPPGLQLVLKPRSHGP